jgi:hypothetical protein
MRTRFVVIALLALLCGSVVAAEAPPMDIPVYPGGESTMEINLTNEDLLPTLKAILPMVKMGGLDKLNPDDLVAALRDVKRIEMLQLDIKKTATESDVVDFYAKKLPPGDWNKVFWQKAGKQGTIVLFVQGMGEQLYGFRVQSAVADEKPIKRVQIVKTEGKIDYVKLLTVAAKIYMP